MPRNYDYAIEALEQELYQTNMWLSLELSTPGGRERLRTKADDLRAAIELLQAGAQIRNALGVLRSRSGS